MATVFFNSWATWVKVTFVSSGASHMKDQLSNSHSQVLGCLVSIVAIGAFRRLGYVHWRLRKYTVVEERERNEQAVRRQMSQRRRAPGTQRSDEVPFGVRAIESGIEVDGVWVSRGNTPEPASRGTSAGSSVWDHVPRRSSEIDLEKQWPLRPSTGTHARSISASTSTTARPSSSAFDIATSAKRVDSRHVSREHSPDAPIAMPAKSRHPPSSYSRYSSNPYLIRSSSAANTLEGIEAIHKASSSVHYRYESENCYGTQSSSSSNISSSDGEPISASAPGLLTGQPRSRKQSADFELLDSHRISQAAETGQLAPRVKKASRSVDWTTLTCAGLGGTIPERNSYFQSRAPSSPTTPKTPSEDTLSWSRIDTIPPAVRRSSMPDVTPFAQFCQTAPRPASCSPPPGSKADKQRPASEAPSIYASAPFSPTVASPIAVAEPAETGPKRTSFEKRESQVLRGHGSGFEVLKPGSLNPPIPADHPMQKQRAAPPVSLQNYNRSRSSSANSGRKLQKKRRQSFDSTTSSEKEWRPR